VEEHEVAIQIPPLQKRLYSGSTPSFFMCAPCTFCWGDGAAKDDPSLAYDSFKTHAEKRCSHCEGRGWDPCFMTAEQLFQAFAPALAALFLDMLPDIVAKTRLAVVEAVMES
jgi:hypothetical protein